MNVSGEASKSGIALADLPGLARDVAALPRLAPVLPDGDAIGRSTEASIRSGCWSAQVGAAAMARTRAAEAWSVSRHCRRISPGRLPCWSQPR